MPEPKPKKRTYPYTRNTSLILERGGDLIPLRFKGKISGESRPEAFTVETLEIGFRALVNDVWVTQYQDITPILKILNVDWAHVERYAWKV